MERRLRSPGLAQVLVAALLFVALTGFAVGAWLRPQVEPVPGLAARSLVAATQHTPNHVGCKHHSHGPRWHDGHGRALGYRSERGFERMSAPERSRLREAMD